MKPILTFPFFDAEVPVSLFRFPIPQFTPLSALKLKIQLNLPSSDGDYGICDIKQFKAVDNIKAS